MGQKIPAFIPKPKTESTELFFSWWFRTELGGYMMVLSCSSGLPSCDLACIFMPVKGCFKHRKRASMVIKHTHTHTHTQKAWPPVWYLHHAPIQTTFAKGNGFENSLHGKNGAGYCSETNAYMRFY